MSRDKRSGSGSTRESVRSPAPANLSASERERKAKEIIAASGVDTQEYFDKVVTQSSNGVTFREQADTWLEGMRNRRRKQPLAPSIIDRKSTRLNSSHDQTS